MVLTQDNAWANLFPKATLIAHISVDILLHMLQPYYLPLIEIDEMVIHVIWPYCEPLCQVGFVPNLG